MKTTRMIRAVAVLALTFAAGACDTGLTEVNENPNNPENVPLESILQSGIWQLAANSAGRGVFGEWTTMFHVSLWPQHLAQSTYNDEDRYTHREGIPDNIWDEMYAGALTDLKNVRDLAAEEGDQNLAAVAEILLVYGFLFLTDLYGDIPYTEALNLEEFPTPEFTAQSAIYPDLLARLATAAGQIQPGGLTPWESGDLIYGGDLERWQEFANSLRLRIAMRISETPAAAAARTAFAAAWAANRFDSHTDNADIDWTGTHPSTNSIWEQIVLEGRTGDFRVSRSMVDALQSRSDPRLPLFAAPAASDGAFRGLPNGFLPAEVGGGSTLSDYSTVGPALLAPESPNVLMSYAEVLFLGAEAVTRGWISGDAAALYREGITASMREYGVSEAEIATYLARPNVQYAGVNSIYLQKWIAVFMQGPEAYNEVRRTGQPVLPLPNQAAIDQIPARMPYPANEGLYNPNFEEDGFADIDYTEPMWWM
jgi:hypothetical protein